VLGEDAQRLGVVGDDAAADLCDLLAHLLGRPEAQLAAGELFDEQAGAGRVAVRFVLARDRDDGAVSDRVDRSTSIDIFTCVDMKGEEMFRRFETTKAVAVEFCERCSQVCDAGCRAAALVERARMQALQFGGRV